LFTYCKELKLFSPVHSLPFDVSLSNAVGLLAIVSLDLRK
jgi:hypothetical protein